MRMTAAGFPTGIGIRARRRMVLTMSAMPAVGKHMNQRTRQQNQPGEPAQACRQVGAVFGQEEECGNAQH